MAANASVTEIAKIRALASDQTKVKVVGAARYSLLSLNLTTDDVCTAIIGVIDAGRRVKKVTLHSYVGIIGISAFEKKLRINGYLIYVKVTIEVADSGEQMLILSAHLDH